jgi:SAM-dependent methyltransferase
MARSFVAEVSLAPVNLFDSLRIARFLRNIDEQRLRKIQTQAASSSSQYAKYADVPRWLKRNLPRVRRLGLDRAEPKRILDLGCGAGFFLFLAKQYGHSGLGLDVGDHPISNELVDLFGVDRKIWRIAALELLPDLGEKFDLITAFSTAFHRHDESTGWGTDEWNFFLDDLFERQLKSGGEVYFEINSGKDGRYFPEQVRKLFLQRGAKVDGEFVSWTKST